MHYRSGLCSTRETICFHGWASDSIKRGPYIIDNDILRIQLKINKGKRKKKKNRGESGQWSVPLYRGIKDCGIKSTRVLPPSHDVARARETQPLTVTHVAGGYRDWGLAHLVLYGEWCAPTKLVAN